MEAINKKNTALQLTYFSIIGNVLLAFIKWLAGFFGNSYALIADAIESTTDVFSSFLVFLGIKYANKPADANHPYGHGRIEPLVTFLIVGFLILSATVIAYKSISNINTPHAMPKVWTLYVLGGIILWKELSYQYVKRKSLTINSTALLADAWHHRSDAITSVTAFIGIGIALLLGKGYEAADDWAALFASGFILYNCYKIFRPAFGELMDEHLYDELSNQIADVSLTVDGIQNTEKCYIRKIGMSYHVDLHARVEGNLTVFEGHELAHVLKNTLLNEIPSISDVMIHIEPTSTQKKD